MDAPNDRHWDPTKPLRPGAARVPQSFPAPVEIADAVYTPEDISNLERAAAKRARKLALKNPTP